MGIANSTNPENSRYRLLVISEVYQPEGGGSEVATHAILHHLKKYQNDLDITVLTGTKKPEILHGIKYIYEPFFARKEKPLLWFNTFQLIKTTRFQKLLEDHDIIYVTRLNFPVIPYAKRKGKKVIVHLHDYAIISYASKIIAPYERHRHRIFNNDLALECVRGLKYCGGAVTLWWLPKLAKRWVSSADYIICVSKRQAEIIAEMVPELRDKIKVIYNPPPPTLMLETPRKEPDSIPTFLYMGGDNFAKGFHLVLRLIRHLAKQNIKARFIFTNNYSVQSLRYIKAAITKTQTVQVEVVGRLNYNELSKIWPRVWALLFPSIWEEPLPYAVMEAALSATVPIAARVGGVPEILKGTPAENYMFTPGDFKEFYKAVVAFISNSPEETKYMGLKLRQHISTLLNEKPREEILKIFMYD